MLDKKIFITNSVIGVTVLITTYLFDRSLVLGKFGGLVFLLYSVIGLALQASVNAIIAALYTFQKEVVRARPYWWSSLILVLLALYLKVIPTFLS